MFIAVGHLSVYEQAFFEKKPNLERDVVVKLLAWSDSDRKIHFSAVLESDECYCTHKNKNVMLALLPEVTEISKVQEKNV